MPTLVTRILGNRSWRKNYNNRPSGSTDRQQLWVLVYDDGPPGPHTVTPTSGLYAWDENPTQRRDFPLIDNYTLIILAENPVANSNAIINTQVTTFDDLSVSVTNEVSHDISTDTNPVQVVDSVVFKHVEAEIRDMTLFDALTRISNLS